ncbi:MAG: diguanylate cyclase [Deltaproteobacteria bacterium]|nr:diguanylate cyclase [Deltaproteobacteria bacterium]
MDHEDLIFYLQNQGRDPSRLVLEDELTGIKNRRFLRQYLEHKVDWRELESHPVSILMLDLDYFKQVNDLYGAAGGNRALVCVAGFLQEAAGDDGIPVRYASDEFLILLPGAGRDRAMEIGQRVIDIFHEKPCQGEEVGGSLFLTTSIGLACGPEDATTGDMLLEKAERALCHAKESGRDCISGAEVVAPELVFTKSALHYLGGGRVAGRKEQLAEVTAALKDFKQRQNQFLLVEGAPGMGKSTFLETVHRSLEQTRIKRVKVSGNAQELFRPYYLVANVLMAFMNLEEDRGMKMLESLSPEETASLGYILPWLGGYEQKEARFDNPAAKRESIFNTVLHFIPKLAKYQPFILLVDDLHFADQASLLVLRHLLNRKEVPVFVCATAADPASLESDSGPLKRFLSAYGNELSVRRSRMASLGPEDIAEHLRGVFQGIEPPESFCKDLAEISQGNPLFLAEILPKLVYDKKISFSDQSWAVEPLEEDYLPRSLEEIIRQKVATLDEESRKLLDHASAFGENVSLSMLTGSTEAMEARVLEFLDQAVAHNLVTVDFQMNDESLRFLGKEVQEIIYESIQEERREQLHEHIGNYQEKLYKEKLVPSAAILAYHFQRSANLEKAAKYEELQAEHNSMVFNAAEAVTYTGDGLGEEVLAEKPLNPSDLRLVLDLLRSFLVAARNTRLYPAGSQLTSNAVSAFMDNLTPLLKNNPVVSFSVENKELYVNNEPLDAGEYKSVAESFVNFLGRHELRAVAFKSGLEKEEAGRFLQGLAGVETSLIGKEFWREFRRERALERVIPVQVRYTRITEEGEKDLSAKSADETLAQAAAGFDGMPQELDAQGQEMAANALRSMLGAASKLKLYPAEGPVATEAINRFTAALEKYFKRYGILTLARVDNQLLINGFRPEARIFEKISGPLLKFLGSSGLISLALKPGLSKNETVEFFTAAGHKLPDAEQDGFWEKFVKEKNIVNLLLNDALYGVVTEGAKEKKAEHEPEPEPEEEEDLEELGQRIRDLFLKGEETEAADLLVNLFAQYVGADELKKQGILHLARDLSQCPELSPSARFLKILAEPMRSAVNQEDQADFLEDMAGILVSIGEQFIHLGDYPLATWVLGHLVRRRKSLDTGKRDKDNPLTRVLRQGVSPAVRNLLASDAASGDASRYPKALQLLAGLGVEGAQGLLEVIRQAQELRIRQMSANLLSKQGARAVSVFKEALMTESSAEIRARMLEVADTVTNRLRSELAYNLGDGSGKVRKAAFALAERLNTAEVAELLVDLSAHESPQVSAEAVFLLGKMKRPQALETIQEVLRSREEPELKAACCQALGSLGDPRAAGDLERVLKKRGPFSRKYRHEPEVRVAAAFALARINVPETIALLAPLDQDPEPRIRQLASKAHTVLEKSKRAKAATN